MIEHDTHCIWLTPEEAAKPFDDIVQSVRDDLVTLRGKLYDVGKLHPSWRERVDFAEGGITCVIAALYDGVEEYRKLHTPNHPK